MRLTRHAQNAYRAPSPGGRAARGFRPISRRFCGFLACAVLLAGSVLSSPPLTALADPADNIAYNQSLPIERLEPKCYLNLENLKAEAAKAELARADVNA